jgi:tetratricopeptide (TPR) repeat protein
MSLVNELKRRKVFRVAAVYAASGFAILEGADLLTSGLGLPDAALRLLTILVVVGLPIALALAWFLEWTPEGIRTTAAAHTPKGRAELVEAADNSLLDARTLVIAGVLVVFGVGLGTGLFLNSGGADLSDDSPSLAVLQAGDMADRMRARVLVIPLQNQTGEPHLAPLGKLCAEWIEQGLVRAAIAHVVPMRQVRGDESGGEGRPGWQPPLEELIERARPTALVTGAYYLVGDEIEVHVDIRLVSDDRLLYKLDPATGPSTDPMVAFEGVSSRVAGALAAYLGVDLGTPELFTPPPSLEAFRQISLADDYFERQEYRRAIEHTDRAYALDTTFIAPLLQAVGSYANLVRLAEADSVLSFLQARRQRLTQIEQLKLEWYEASFRGDLEGRYRVARALFEMAPADWAYGAAFAAVRANYPSAALDYLALRDLTTSWGRNWAPWDYQHTNALFMLKRDEEGLDAIRAAKTRYPGDRVLLYREAWALAALGRLAEVEPVVEEARGLGAEFVTEVIIDVAEMLRSLGRTDESKGWAHRALAEAERATGDTRELRALGHYFAEEWEAALLLFESLSDEEPENVDRLGWLGSTLARLGRRQEAEAVIGQLEMPGVPYLRGFNTRRQAYIRAVLGDEQEALRLLEESYARGVYHNPWVRSNVDLESLRANPRFDRVVTPRG